MDEQEILAANTRLRLELADVLDGLTEEQLDTPSLCTEWRVRDVAGHLTSVVANSQLTLLAEIIRSGFRVHRGSAALGRRVGSQPIAELTAKLRAHAGKPFIPPRGAANAPLADLLIHGGDIRVPLGIDMDFDPVLVAEALDFLATSPAGFVPKSRLAGLTLVATDTERRWLPGGAEVYGQMTDLMLAAAGRSAVLDRLTGPGVATLRSRISA